jgi:hypothetical protein
VKTIADIKRKMVVGSVWHTLWEACGCKTSNMGERRCGVVQSNSFGFDSKKNFGEFSWCDWPKKSEVLFLSEKQFQIIQGNIKLTYTFIR